MHTLTTAKKPAAAATITSGAFDQIRKPYKLNFKISQLPPIVDASKVVTREYQANKFRG